MPSTGPRQRPVCIMLLPPKLGDWALMEFIGLMPPIILLPLPCTLAPLGEPPMLDHLIHEGLVVLEAPLARHDIVPTMSK